MIAAVVLVAQASATPIDGMFNYQGRLTSGGVPITGTADVRFSLWDAAAAGAQVGATVTRSGQTVTDGLFNADLEFGVDAFVGEQRWLRVEVRSPAGVGSYVDLGRQAITSAPSALSLRTPLSQEGVAESYDAQPHMFELINHGSGGAAKFTCDGSVPGAHTLRVDSNNTNSFAALGIYASNSATGLFVQSQKLALDAFTSSDSSGTATFSNSSTTNPSAVLRVLSSGVGPAIEAQPLGNGAALSALGEVEIGSTAVDGTLRLFNSGYTGLLSEAYSTHGTELLVFDETAHPYSTTQPDADGIGGYFAIRRNTVSSGFTVDGNYSNSESPRVTIAGAGSSVVFNTSATGNSSVALPDGSILAPEIGDEPGVASSLDGTNAVVLGGVGVVTILSRTITCPTAGYCVVIGTCQAQVGHVSGSYSTANFGVTDTAGSLPINQDVSLQYAADAGGGTYTAPVTVHGTFSVGAGANTFYLGGEKLSGTWFVYDSQLTIMFFPTSYGTVSPTLMAAPGHSDADAPRVLPMSAQEIESERLQTLRFDVERTRAELGAQAARMEQLRRELDAITRRQEAVGEATPARRVVAPKPPRPASAESQNTPVDG